MGSLARVVVFGVSLECSRIEKETQASASLESVAGERFRNNLLPVTDCTYLLYLFVTLGMKC